MKDLKIIAIVGMSGAGKSVAVDYITRRGVPKVHFGNMIYREMEKRGIPITPDSQREFRESFAKPSPKSTTSSPPAKNASS